MSNNPDWVTCCVCQSDLEGTKAEFTPEEWPQWLDAGCCCEECFSELEEYSDDSKAETGCEERQPSQE